MSILMHATQGPPVTLDAPARDRSLGFAVCHAVSLLFIAANLAILTVTFLQTAS
jgi:hypothetical protein